jgi:uncharacterized membrane protein YgdD (TMEM256/DUF423 family)
MKDEKYALAKLLFASALIFIVSIFSVDNTNSGFHVHDTYFVISNVAKYAMFAAISLFIGSLLASIFTLFRNKLFVKILIFSGLLLISGGMYIFAMFGYGR